jgi:2-polyprenyl-3-methyl-5-hydroxy-6-metoxy-1,4-benzoquinol methylase
MNLPNVMPRAGESNPSDERLRTLLDRYYTRYYRETLGLPGWRERVTGRLAEQEFGLEQLRGIERAVGVFAGKRLLNVGCGTGGFNAAAERAGARTWGIDASQEAIAICGLRGALGAGGRYSVAAAEALPFRNGAFDLVVCLSTLEHVADVKASLTEMVRVLRPGGGLFLYAPSGWACYESHYKLAWLPWCPRPLAQVYLRVRGRPTGFAGTLNTLSVRQCRRVLELAGARVEELSVGTEDQTGGSLLRAYYRTLGVKPYIALLARKPAA